MNKFISKKVTKNKALEIDLNIFTKYIQWFNVSFDTRRKCDHPGIYFSVDFLKFLSFNFSFYDIRHWDYSKNTYCNYEDVSYT